MGQSSGRGRIRARFLGGLLALLAVAVAGCGGSDTSEERAQADEDIRAVLIENLTAGDDVEIACSETVTMAYVDQLYGGEDECRDLISGAGQSSPAEPDEIEFEAVDVNDSDASVQVAVNGGDLEGVEGGVTLVEDPEAGWLFDDFDGDLARSSVLVALRSNGELPEALVDCIEDELFGDDADDEQVKTTYVDLIREGEDASEEIVSAGRACARTPQEGGGGNPGGKGGGGNSGGGGGSPSLDPAGVDREDFEKSLRQNLINQQGLSEKVAGCTIKRLRRTLSDAEVATIIESAQQGEEPPAQIIRKLTRAGAVCARSEAESNEA